MHHNGYTISTDQLGPNCPFDFLPSYMSMGMYQDHFPKWKKILGKSHFDPVIPLTNTNPQPGYAVRIHSPPPPWDQGTVSPTAVLLEPEPMQYSNLSEGSASADESEMSKRLNDSCAEKFDDRNLLLTPAVPHWRLPALRVGRWTHHWTAMPLFLA